jgi:hypothetical protein
MTETSRTIQNDKASMPKWSNYGRQFTIYAPSESVQGPKIRDLTQRWQYFAVLLKVLER